MSCSYLCSCISSVRPPLNTLFVSILVSSFLDPRVNRDSILVNLDTSTFIKTFVLNIGKSVGFESKSSYHHKAEESGSALHPEPA